MDRIMASIGEQIIAARKAKGMTQDALSQALNISRSAVSQWERDRRMPDAETLLRLSSILNYSFTIDSSKMPETAPQEAERASDTVLIGDRANEDAPKAKNSIPPQGEASPTKKRRWIILCAAAVVLCAALLLIPALKGRTPTVPPTSAAVDPDTVTKAFFQQDNVNSAGQPFLNIDSTLTTQKNDGMDMWLYTLTFHEKNGYPFRIDKLESYTFVGDAVHPMEISRDTIEAAHLATDIPAHGDWSFDGGLPVQESVSGIGFVLRGADESGAALSFVFYQPFAIK